MKNFADQFERDMIAVAFAEAGVVLPQSSPEICAKIVIPSMRLTRRT